MIDKRVRALPAVCSGRKKAALGGFIRYRLSPVRL